MDSTAGYNAQRGPNAADGDGNDIEMVYGIAPVLNALRNDRRRKHTLYCQDGLAPANKKDRAAAGAILALAGEANVL